MKIGGGTIVKEKMYVVVGFASFQNVPRNGHCLCAKLNLNETEKKKGGACRGSSTAEPTSERLHVSQRVCDTTQSRMEADGDGATHTEPRWEDT